MLRRCHTTRPQPHLMEQFLSVYNIINKRRSPTKAGCYGRHDFPAQTRPGVRLFFCDQDDDYHVTPKDLLEANRACRQSLLVRHVMVVLLLSRL
jgi:hypothetical protein